MEQTLIAEFPSAAIAARMAKELKALLAKSAKEFDRAAAKAGEWPDEPTPAALAFGKRYGVSWEEPLTWGNDRLAGSEPEVGQLDRALVLFHNNMAGGFGAELPRVLSKAGAKVRSTKRPVILYGEIAITPTTRALVAKLELWFAQRLDGAELQSWTRPPWARSAPRFGRAADVRFVVDAKMCAFTLPGQPSDLATLTVFFKRQATLRIATDGDEKSLAKREARAGAAPAAKAKVTAKATPVPKTETRTIPAKLPTVTRTSTPPADALFSAGDTVYALVGAHITRNGTQLAKPDKEATAIFVDGTEVYCAGAGLWRSKDGGKSVTKLAMPTGVDPEYWGKPFHGVAKDSSGVVWAGGSWVVSVRGDKVVHEKKPFGDDPRIKAVVRTSLGVILLTFTGGAFLVRDGEAHKLTLRGRGHASDACVTPRGTLIVVGSGPSWSAEIYRSEDGGATFKPVKHAKLAPLQAVAALPDGRLVAGGAALLLGSLDDGKTWKTVKAPEGVSFDRMCSHGDAVMVADAATIM